MAKEGLAVASAPMPAPSDRHPRRGSDADPKSARSSSRLAHALADPGPLMRLVWAVLAGVPVLWVVEYVGPRWLNLLLRGLWVVAAVAAVIACAVAYHRRRRARA